ncbi:MAG: SPASM domain-containing protein, partial [Lentisphaerota bacterium]
YINWDCSKDGFEGTRAQEILPLLIERFNFETFIGFGSAVDIFVDRCFGHHFSPNRKEDTDFIDRVHKEDEEGLLNGSLTPTHMLASLVKYKVSEPYYSRGLAPVSCVRKSGPAIPSVYSSPQIQFREGFYPLEDDYRWIARKGKFTVKNITTPSRICFDLICAKADLYSQFPFNVFIYAGESGAYSFTFEESMQNILISFPVDETDIEVNIESDQFFVPAKKEGSADIRELSLKFKNFRTANNSVSTDNPSNRVAQINPDNLILSLKKNKNFHFYGEINNPDYLKALDKFILNPTVMLELNSKCNFYCNYCRSAQSKRQKSFMSPELFRVLLPQLKDITTLPLRFHIDGEPTLHPQFLELSLEANQAGHRIALATNGSNLRKDFLQIDMDVIINISCSEKELQNRSSMNFSTYVSRLEQYVRDWLNDNSAQTILFKIYTSGLERMNNAIVSKKHHFASEFLTRLGIRDKVTSHNEALSSQFAYNKPSGGVFLLTIEPLAEGGLYPDVSGLISAGESSLSANGYCDSAWKVLSVLSDGKVCFCCVDVTGETSFTQPEEIWTKGLKEIWLNHSKIRQYREEFLSGSLSFPICRKCLDAVPNREQYIFPTLFPYTKTIK